MSISSNFTALIKKTFSQSLSFYLVTRTQTSGASITPLLVTFGVGLHPVRPALAALHEARDVPPVLRRDAQHIEGHAAVLVLVQPLVLVAHQPREVQLPPVSQRLDQHGLRLPPAGPVLVLEVAEADVHYAVVLHVLVIVFSIANMS